MEKYIEKTYMVEDENITIQLTDTRDNYIYEDALGEIGSICLSPLGVIIFPTYSVDERQDKLKEMTLLLSFKEIFGEEKYNPLSKEYYQKIKTMIENGTLDSMGYIQEHDENTKNSNLSLNRKY